MWCCLKHDINWTCCQLNLLRKTAETEAAPSSFFESLNLRTPKNRHGLKKDGAIFRTWQCYRWLTANFRNAVGPCIDLSVHVPNSYLKVVFNYLILTWELIVRFPMDPNTAYVLESRLISMDGATQIPILECEATRWHNSKVCVCWYFRSGNSKAFYCPPNTSSRQKIAAAHT